MGRDLFSSLKQQKAAISYKKGFPLLALRLPTGTTLRFFGIRPRRGGQAGLSSPFWGENSKRVKGPENPWPSPPRGTRYGSHDERSPRRGCREGCAVLTLLSSRSLFLAAAASSCSAASCFSFSSSWRFRTATGSPFCVACQRGVAHQWGPPSPDPSPPTPREWDPALCSRGKIQLRSPRVTFGASLPKSRVPSLPSAPPEAR